ncbi:MAG: hypothetical protein JW943_06700 [Deltaproteobacteria bacterium]|nr:hypothetical protein [Deltaproteobacteria bacterium]
MKIRIYLMAVLLFFVSLPVVHAQEYGKMKALQQRAAQITKQKNDFIVRVLTSYAIGYELNAQGTVVRINMDNQWLDVNAIDIVPVLKESVDKRQYVAAHEIFFHTADNNILDLVSELIIR